MNVFGGEDRFWLGPEGGHIRCTSHQEPSSSSRSGRCPRRSTGVPGMSPTRLATAVSFRKHMTLTNYAGTRLEADVNRRVRLLNGDDTAKHLGMTPSNDVHIVAFESSNTITNAGRGAWRRESGLISVWILGQFNPSPVTTIVIPFEPGPESSRGAVVNDAYFGKVPADRLVVGGTANLLQGRRTVPEQDRPLSIPRPCGHRAATIPASHALTLVESTHPSDAREYVNSMWEIQREPFQG